MSGDKSPLEIFILSSRFAGILRLSLNGETENSLRYFTSVFVLIAVLALAGCIGSDSESGEHSGDSESGESRGDSESGENSGDSESGENRGDSESGEHRAGRSRAMAARRPERSSHSTKPLTRSGPAPGWSCPMTRLVLSYDSTSNAFIGNVENTTDTTLRRVRVEVHLSNGTELGPTTPTDLAPVQSLDIIAAGNRPALHYLERPPRGRLIAHARNGAGGMDCGVSPAQSNT